MKQQLRWMVVVGRKTKSKGQTCDTCMVTVFVTRFARDLNIRRQYTSSSFLGTAQLSHPPAYDHQPPYSVIAVARQRFLSPPKFAASSAARNQYSVLIRKCSYVVNLLHERRSQPHKLGRRMSYHAAVSFPNVSIKSYFSNHSPQSSPY